MIFRFFLVAGADIYDLNLSTCLQKQLEREYSECQGSNRGHGEGSICFLLVCSFAYSSILKMEVTCSSETWFTLNELHAGISREIKTRQGISKLCAFRHISHLSNLGSALAANATVAVIRNSETPLSLVTGH
jgi:hypothetical protein